MPTGETAAHARLKQLALAWARENGFPIAAPEVRLPHSGYRVDAAAYRPAQKGRGSATVVFECKQSRADLLKDARAEAATRRELADLLARRDKLEELLATHRPDLRRGESLFPEFDTFDFTAAEHRTYAQVLHDIAKLQRRLLGGVKFDRIFRYRAADLLHLVAEDGIFARDEVPAGWGLLVRRGDTLVLERKPVRLEPVAGSRVALLERIALAATKRRPAGDANCRGD
jgi:hypothetical protein